MFELIVHFPGGTRRLEIPDDQPGRTVTQVLRRAELALNTRCDQRGLCNGCLIHVRSGALQQLGTDQPTDPSAAEPLQRACQLGVPKSGRAEIQIPPRSLLAHQPQVVTSFRINVPRAQHPLWQTFTLPSATLGDRKNPLAALQDAVATALDSPLPIRMAVPPDALSDGANSDACVAVQQRGDHWLVTPLDAPLPAYGAAVDVGTTTVVVVLVELSSGEVASSVSALNSQTRLGDNVLTRINVCMTKPHMVARLQHAVVQGTIRPLLQQAIADSGIDPRQLVCLVTAGNATMLHLLAGVNPAPMGTAPFPPVLVGHHVRSTSDVGLDLAQLGRRQPSAPGDAADDADDAVPPRAVHLLPGAAAYVGADITSGVLASGMVYHDRTCLLVDLGTNGEIVLKHGDKLIGCATAAGPAFEGAGMICGVRAGRGAVSHLWFEPPNHDLRFETIGSSEPIGVCGTAYIDFLSRARSSRLIGNTGRFAAECPAELVTEHEQFGRSLVITRNAAGEPILITEPDIASLLQAKAAIAAGIVCLLRRADLAASDIDTVYLAGGFGFHMHADSLVGCGMFPGFQPHQIEMVGNTSLAGAYLALLDSGALDQLKEISRSMEIVELNLEPGFETTYIDQLSLPTPT